MQKQDTSLVTLLSPPQLEVGPISPNPGPIFPIAEAEAVNEVSKLNDGSATENIMAERTKINM